VFYILYKVVMICQLLLNEYERYLLSLEWKRVGVMDNDSGDNETDELREFG